MDPLVLLEVARLRKAFAAAVTAERSLSGVDPLVGLEVGQTRESFTTHPTDVTPPPTLPRYGARRDAGVGRFGPPYWKNRGRTFGAYCGSGECGCDL